MHILFYSILFYPITLEGRRGTTAALVELAKSIPVHSLILSSHLFSCLPLFLCPFSVPCRIVVAKPKDLETWSNHLSFRFLTRVRSLSYSPVAAWIYLQTSPLGYLWSAHYSCINYSQLSLSRIRLSRITAYLEEKSWSLF